MVELKKFINRFTSFRRKHLRFPRIVLSWQNVLLTLALLSIPIFGFYLWKLNTTVPTLETALKSLPTQISQVVTEELRSAPSVSFKKEKDTFIVTDDGASGIKIEYPNKPKGDEQKLNEPPKDILKLSFPNDYATPIGIDLGQGKSFTLADQSAVRGYRSELINSTLNQKQAPNLDAFTKKRVDEMKKQAEKDKAPTQDVLSYRSPDNRKTILYSYRADQAQGAKKLKSWTIYAKGSGTEKESYLLNGATAKINDAGDLDIFLVTQQDTQNESVKSQVDPSLLERARKTLEKENAGNIDGNRAPDLSIPKPFYVDKDGNHYGADWAVSDGGKTFSVSIGDASGRYPIALDPTLSFAAPGYSNSGSVITGEPGSYFGNSMTAGDFNADGKTDLVVGASAYNSNMGRVYIFYNDSFIVSEAIKADVTITGEGTGNYFGNSMIASDLNADGKTDLAVGAYLYSSTEGRVYIFYGDGTYSTDASSADVKISGGSSGQFGGSIASGDFNADGKSDLVVGAHQIRTAYIYYNDGSYPSYFTSADVSIAGESGGFLVRASPPVISMLTGKLILL